MLIASVNKLVMVLNACNVNQFLNLLSLGTEIYYTARNVGSFPISNVRQKHQCRDYLSTLDLKAVVKFSVLY